MQAIIINGSPESGSIDQTEPTGVARLESKEADPILSALQVIPPSDRAEGQPSRLKFMWSGLPRPTLPDRIITNCYAPSRGLEPPRVEISTPGADEVKHIMRRWEPFHRGESAADRLNNLYSHMLRISVVARGMGLGEDYTVSVPAGTRKEDIQWIIDDGIQVRNRNYVQSTELRAITESARLRAESERGVAHKALSLAGEACTKAEEENSRLTDERLSLILELGTIKDDFAAFREKVVTDREAMEAKFDASDDTLFNYGYGCCVFTHNICGSKPQISDGMPDPSVPLTPEFFANPRCPPSTSSAAPALDPAAVSREERPENNPTATKEEATLSMDLPASSDSGVKDAVAN